MAGTRGRPHALVVGVGGQRSTMKMLSSARETQPLGVGRWQRRCSKHGRGARRRHFVLSPHGNRIEGLALWRRYALFSALCSPQHVIPSSAMSTLLLQPPACSSWPVRTDILCTADAPLMLEIAPGINSRTRRLRCPSEGRKYTTMALHPHAPLFMRGCGVALSWGRRGPVRGHRSLLPNQRLGTHRASNMAPLCFQPHLSCLVYALGLHHVYHRKTTLVRFLPYIYLSASLPVCLHG